MIEMRKIPYREYFEIDGRQAPHYSWRCRGCHEYSHMSVQSCPPEWDIGIH